MDSVQDRHVLEEDLDSDENDRIAPRRRPQRDAESEPWQAGNGYHVHAPNTNKHQYAVSLMLGLFG